MTKKIASAVLALSLSPLSALACQVYSANIVGQLVGNDVKGKACYISVEVSEVNYAGINCKLKMKAGQEVLLKTGIAARNCPDDETTVTGKVSSIGGELVFEGQADARNH